MLRSDEREFIAPAPECLSSLYMMKSYSFIGFHEVDPSTVGQYTGLTDKNGKRIFEGDICEVVRFDTDSHEYKSQIFLVEWIESGFGLYSQSISGELVMFIGISDMEDIEVIGNIHENPEMIKE